MKSEITAMFENWMLSAIFMSFVKPLYRQRVLDSAGCEKGAKHGKNRVLKSDCF